MSGRTFTKLSVARAVSWFALLVAPIATAEEMRPESQSADNSKIGRAQNAEKPRLPSPGKRVLADLLKRHNEVRSRRGLPALKLHGKLTAAAQRYAEYSHRTGVLSHYADGRDPGQRISAEGVSHGSWAENMAWGQSSPEEAMSTWLSSGAHHGNILSNHSHVGFGKIEGTWVTVFADVAE